MADETPAISSVNPQKFQLQVETIISQGYQIIPLDMVLNLLKNRLRLPDKAVAVTFDDAYKDTFTNAYPILKRNKIPFTVFVATDCTNPASNQFLNWAEIREIASNGALIANHAHLLTRRSDKSQNQ